VKTSDGDVYLHGFNGSTLLARSSDGDITIDELIAERSTIHTSDGGITLRGVEGDLTASSSDGSLRIDLANPGEVTVTTPEGDITITVPSDLSADLQLRGDDVRISSQLEFRGNVKDERADGELRGGGLLIKARTSDSDVTIRNNCAKNGCFLRVQNGQSRT